MENYMTENGFIKLHRSILKWEWYQDSNTKVVFLHLLLNAQWEDSRFQGYVVPKGSLVTSYDSIASHLNISQKNARTAIEHLKKSGEVAVKRHSHFSIVTIVNWEKYQCFESVDGNQNGNQSAINRQSIGNIKEYKNIRNKELYNSNLELYRKNISGNYDFEALEREVTNEQG